MSIQQVKEILTTLADSYGCDHHLENVEYSQGFTFVIDLGKQLFDDSFTHLRIYSSDYNVDLLEMTDTYMSEIDGSLQFRTPQNKCGNYRGGMILGFEVGKDDNWEVAFADETIETIVLVRSFNNNITALLIDRNAYFQNKIKVIDSTKYQYTSYAASFFRDFWDSLSRIHKIRFGRGYD